MKDENPDYTLIFQLIQLPIKTDLIFEKNSDK